MKTDAYTRVILTIIAICLAAIVLRERIAPVQWIGLALALVAAATLGSHQELSILLGLG